MIFSTNEMLARRMGGAKRPEPEFYADPPEGIVKLYSWDANSCHFYRISLWEFNSFKEFWPRWSSLPKGCGAQYICFGEYPIAQEFMLEGTQYTDGKRKVEWEIGKDFVRIKTSDVL
jgi:hypothetical protein